jgi:hypothetical protein
MTAEPAALLALAASVEAGDGPDRQLDARIEGLIGPESETPGSHLLGGFHKGRDHYLRTVSPRYTASVDAALALMADVLPGYVCTSSTYGFASKMPIADVYREGHEGRAQGKASTLPRAIVAAVLRAMAGRG